MSDVAVEQYSSYPEPPRADLGELFYGFRTRELRRHTLEALGNTTGYVLQLDGVQHKGFGAIGQAELPNGLVIADRPGEAANSAQIMDELNVRESSLGAIITGPFARWTPDMKVSSAYADMPPELSTDLQYRNNMAAFMWGAQGIEASPADNMWRYLIGTEVSDKPWDDAQVMSSTPAVQLLLAARRALEPNGLLVYRNVSKPELAIAEELGFALVGSYMPRRQMPRMGFLRGEFVLKLVDMSTSFAIGRGMPYRPSV